MPQGHTKHELYASSVMKAEDEIPCVADGISIDKMELEKNDIP